MLWGVIKNVASVKFGARWSDHWHVWLALVCPIVTPCIYAQSEPSNLNATHSLYLLKLAASHEGASFF